MKVTKAVRVVAPVLAETTKKKGETKPLQAVLPRVSIRAQDAPGSVSDGVKRAATEREQAVLRGVEARVATVLAEHAGTIAIASQPLTDLEASAARRAMAQLQHELTQALSAVLPGSGQRELAQLIALVRSASPYGDKTRAPASFDKLSHLQAALAPFVAAADLLAAKSAKGTASLTHVLERAGVTDPKVPDTVNKATAQAWLTEVIAQKPTLRSMASREAAWRLLSPIVKNDVPLSANDLDAQAQSLANTVMLRPDGYFASLATGDAVAHCEDDRLQVGRTFTLHAGVLSEGAKVVGQVKPLDDRIALRAVVGAGRSLDQMIEGMSDLLQHPVDTLGPVLPNIARLIVSSPEYYERFVALPPAEQADALGGLAMNVGLFLLGGKAATGAPAAVSFDALPLLTLDANGALALASASTAVATDEAAIAALTLHMAQAVEAKRPRSIDMKHITQGEVVTNSEKANGRWKKMRLAKGFHLESANENARLVRGTKTAPDKNGVYQARVEILDPKSGLWAPKRSPSSFFPAHYTHADVLRAIEEAYANMKLEKDRWIGKSSQGIRIQFYVDESGHVASAFPWMETL